MNTPHLYQVSDLVNHCETVKQHHPEAGWIPARPLGWQGLALVRRLKVAWGVFTGRYDAVFWEPTLMQCWHKEDNSDLRELLGKAIEATKGEKVVNIFTAPAVPSKINAATSATDGAPGSRILAATSATNARTFEEPHGEEQVADEAAVMAAIAAGTQMYNH